MAKRKTPQQPQKEVQVDLKKAETIKCDDCGNCGKVPKMFIEGAGLGLEEVNKPKEDALSRPDLMG
jgi:hypothetical protein